MKDVYVLSDLQSHVIHGPYDVYVDIVHILCNNEQF